MMFLTKTPKKDKNKKQTQIHDIRNDVFAKTPKKIKKKIRPKLHDIGNDVFDKNT